MSSGTDDAPPSPDHSLEILLWSGGTNKCHIPLRGAPRCGVDADLRQKSVAVVPPAHRDWCRSCVALWRQAITADDA